MEKRVEKILHLIFRLNFPIKIVTCKVDRDTSEVFLHSAQSIGFQC